MNFKITNNSNEPVNISALIFESSSNGPTTLTEEATGKVFQAAWFELPDGFPRGSLKTQIGKAVEVSPGVWEVTFRVVQVDPSLRIP